MGVIEDLKEILSRGKQSKQEAQLQAITEDRYETTVQKVTREESIRREMSKSSLSQSRAMLSPQPD